MKLSFSFSKTAPPKKVVHVQPQQVDPQTLMREVIAVSSSGGIMVEKTAEDLEREAVKTLVIPCRTLYTKLERTALTTNVSGDSDLVDDSVGSPKMRKQPVGLTAVAPDLDSTHASSQSKRAKSSILMQIMEAKRRGDVIDAPTQEVRTLDANEFGWALLRGMGYDESKESAVDVTKTVVGNRAKLGIGVKLDVVTLPTDKSKK